MRWHARCSGTRETLANEPHVAERDGIRKEERRGTEALYIVGEAVVRNHIQSMFHELEVHAPLLEAAADVNRIAQRL